MYKVHERKSEVKRERWRAGQEGLEAGRTRSLDKKGHQEGETVCRRVAG